LEDVLPEDILQNLLRHLPGYHLNFERRKVSTPIVFLDDLTDDMRRTLNRGSDWRWVDPVDEYLLEHMMELAMFGGKPMIGLTDIFYAMLEVLDVPLETQIYALADFPDYFTMLMKMFDEANAYEAQDFDRLRVLLEAQPENPYTLYRRDEHLQRSHAYAEEIARLLREAEEPTTFFIMLDIGHIIGGDLGRMFVILEEMGFKIESLWN
jgi:hypothetical protein